MRLIRRRAKKEIGSSSKRTEEESKPADDFNRSPPWKIAMMLVFLAVLIVLLLKDDGQETVKKKSRKIPNPEVPLSPSPSVMHTFKNAAVSSDSQVCSDITRNFLNSGANVFDSSLAGLVCCSLTQFQSMGLLGGFLLTVFLKSERKSIVIDAQMASPRDFKLPVLNLTDIKYGSKAVAIPGFMKGMWEIHRKYGNVSWKSLVQPTAKLCREGLVISKHFYESMLINQRISSDLYLRDVLMDSATQTFKKPGTKVYFTKTCDFLDILANHTEEEIYSGSVGEIVSQDLKNLGGFLTIEDLKEYKVKWSEALEYSMSERDVLLFPNTASVLVPAILNILRSYQFNASSFDSEMNINETILTHHRIVEAFKHTFAARSHLGDPDFLNIKSVVNHLLSPEFADNIRNLIDDTTTFPDPKKYASNFIAPEDHGTSHISVIAPNGDALSVTSSINYYFGAGVTGNRTGLIFNNGMDDFSYPNRDVNYFGLKETPTNYLEPGKRALSSMSPLIVVDKESGEVKLVIGAAGGSKIISALALALLRYNCCTTNIKEIVDAPRLHHQLLPNHIEYEFGVVSSIIDGLKALGHETRRFRNRGTIVNALSTSKGVVNAIADYRKDWSGVAGY